MPVTLLNIVGFLSKKPGHEGLDTKILVVEIEHLLLSSKSWETGTNDISSHNPSRRATRTIASTTANKAQIHNHSIEDIHKNPKDPDKNPGMKP